MTPFAVGSATGGRGGAAGRPAGRLLTVWGLVAVMLGLGTTALVLWLAPSDRAAWIAAPALLVGGLGSGCCDLPEHHDDAAGRPGADGGRRRGRPADGTAPRRAVGTAALPGALLP
ncbi:hypothetical protein LV779_26080 [Streptomyces thinghirensis]|nr:hypothetical protein [Streptomyces thinghirensis]